MQPVNHFYKNKFLLDFLSNNLLSRFLFNYKIRKNNF